MVEFGGDDCHLGHYLPMHYASIGLLSTLLLTMLLLSAVRRKVRKGSGGNSPRGIPGPRTYWLGSYLNFLQMANRRKNVRSLTSWYLDTKGPIMKLCIGPYEMFQLLSPDYVQKLFSSMIAEHLVKPSLGYSLLKPVAWFDGIFHSSGDKWKGRRKLISPAFGHASARRWVPALNEGAARLVGALEILFENAGGSHHHTHHHPIYSLILDTSISTFASKLKYIILTCLKGNRRLFLIIKAVFGTNEHESHDDLKTIAEYVKRGLEIVGTRLTQGWLILDPLFRLTSMFGEQQQMTQWSQEFIQKRVQVEHNRRKSEAERGGTPSILGEFIKSGLPPDGLYEETLTMMIAGYETTLIALHSALFLLALHPSIQEKARREVDSVFEDEDLCDDVNGHISEGGVAKLKYLEQCVLESLRMVPPAPSFGRELSAPLVLDEGLELPAGTIVGVWIPGIHMNPEYYPNPGRYDPDRFSPEMSKTRHTYSFMTFSAGPRKCVGYRFAMMQLLILTAHVLRNFTIRTTDKFEDVVWLWNITLTPETPIKFSFERRSLSAAHKHNYKSQLLMQKY